MAGLKEYSSNFPPKKMPIREKFCINCGVVKHKQIIKKRSTGEYVVQWMCIRCTAHHTERRSI